MCHLGFGHTNTFEFWPVIPALSSICYKEKLALPRQRANGCWKGSITFLQGCVGYLIPSDLSRTHGHQCIAEQIQEIVYTHIYIDIDGCVTVIIKEEIRSLCREGWSNGRNFEGVRVVNDIGCSFMKYAQKLKCAETTRSVAVNSLEYWEILAIPVMILGSTTYGGVAIGSLSEDRMVSTINISQRANLEWCFKNKKKFLDIWNFWCCSSVYKF